MLVEEARAVLPAFEAWAKLPAGEEGVRRVIKARFMLFPQPTRSDPDWALWWADYIMAVGHFPEHAIEAGMQAWLKTPDQFLPKPGELLALIQTTPSSAYRAVSRMRQVIAARPEAAIPWSQKPRDLPTAADRELVRQIAADFTARTMPKETDKPKERTHFGRPPEVDEVGITPQMREAMARRYGPEGEAASGE